MTPERVLEHRALVLDQRARERYFEDGFLTVPSYVGSAWLERLPIFSAQTAAARPA